MKHRLQTLLKHKLQWLVLLTALLGVSQGVWGDTYYVKGSWDNTSHSISGSAYTVELPANASYTFKISKNNSTWYGTNGGTISNTVTGWGLYSDLSGNATLNTGSSAGTFSFAYNSAQNNEVKINVTFPGSGCTPYDVFFDNSSTNWDNVYVWFYDGEYWNNNCSGSNNKGNATTMSRVGSSSIYKATNTNCRSVVVFNKNEQNNYGNFHQTEVVYSDGNSEHGPTITGTVSSSTPVFTPDKTTSQTCNSSTYYGGAWGTPCAKPTVSFDSPVTSVCSGTTQSYTANGSTSTGTISSYTWSVSGTGWSRSDSGTSSSATFNTGTGTGTITVTATNSCENTSDEVTQEVYIKGNPSAPSFSTGATKLCEGSTGNGYTITGTADAFIWENNGNGISWHSTPASSDKTVKVDVASSITDEATTYVRVMAQNCGSLNSAYATRDITLYKSASAGTVNLTKNSVCVNESGITASRAETWYSGGGTYEWSTTSGTGTASIDSETGAITALTAGTVTVKCTIDDPACGSTANSSAALTINGPEAFTIGASPASPKPWEVVTLSTSPSTSATWSITANPSGKAYLNTTSGSSTKLKAPYDASANTVKASITSGGCTQEATESVSIGSEACN